jgi:hypothetical protein
MKKWIWIGICGTLLTYCAPPATTGNGGGVSQPPDQVIENLVEDFQDLSVEFQELAKPNKVEAWVDQLIVKAQPGENMPEIGRMREGEIATYLKQRTLRKTEFTLRGQRYYEPWILIKTKDSVMGWVHQGGIRFVQPNLLSDLISPEVQTQTRSLDGSSAISKSNQAMFIPGKQVGPITLNTSEEELIRLFGPGQVQRGTVNTSNVNIEQCTIVFPNINDELRITWKDQSRSEVKAVYILRPGGKWHSEQGLKVGMDLLALTKANESPVNFYGFNWEYGGVVDSWKNGRLSKYAQQFYIALAPSRPISSKLLLNKFSGNTIFSSNTEGVEQLDLVVSKIVVYLDK